jgi:hypothetical protein
LAFFFPGGIVCFFSSSFFHVSVYLITFPFARLFVHFSNIFLFISSLSPPPPPPPLM